MEDINDMKIMWKELNDRISHLENENRKLMQKVMKSDYHTAREKLVNKYIAFIFLELLMVVFMTLFFIFNPEVNEDYRIAALVYWDVFFLIEAGFDSYLLYRIKNIDIYNSSVTEVTRMASMNWKLHKLGILLGLPLAIGAILMFALAMNANQFTIIGMAVGGVIGLIIGLSQLMKFKNYYYLLTSNDD